MAYRMVLSKAWPGSHGHVHAWPLQQLSRDCGEPESLAKPACTLQRKQPDSFATHRGFGSDRTIEADGGYEDLCLTESSLEELSNFCNANKCLGDGNHDYSFHWTEKCLAESKYGKRFSLAHYSNLMLRCPAANKLAHDPILRGIARGYFNAEPVLIAVRAWWSFATNDGPQANNGQTYHFDIDGYRSVAFFFYLTDVDAGSGAHIYIRGSHLHKRVSHLMSLHKSRSDKEIEEFYPADDIRVICGKAGTGFAEDTFCFHKGSAPRLRDRLMLQVRFGLRDYGTGRED